MKLIVRKSKVTGKIRIPGSKSHTIRALYFASLADGRSEILQPLLSNDALSAVNVCRALGAKIEPGKDRFIVDGFGGKPSIPENVIDVGNSGTTINFGIMVAALSEGYSVFTGDYQIRRRTLAPLLKSINDLRAQAISTTNNDCPPIIIKGRATGGHTIMDGITSQYLSSLLISTPLLEKDTTITLTRLNEAPYVDMTLWWLDKQDIRYTRDGYKAFHISSNQSYKPFTMPIPGDFSSATFFMVQAAVSGEEMVLENLDMTDPQGDKLVLSILEDMGAKVKLEDGQIRIKGDKLIGREIDMNSIPDALPAMAVLGCFAEGETRLVNVAQARLKETDRIKVMCRELTRMGADITELPDGLVIRRSNLHGAHVKGHDDHRIVMSLAIAGLNVENETVIDSAEAMNVTFPEFADFVRQCGGDIEIYE